MIDRDTIIKLAREAHWATAHGGMPTTSPWWDMDVPALERFAALVAAAEREACAKVCEDAISSIWEFHPEYVTQVGRNVCTNLAAAIRARNNL